MKTPRVFGRRSLAALLAIGLVIVGCELPRQPEQKQATACGGTPDWCLIATSEMDGHRPAYVYLDGKEEGLVLPNKSLTIPVRSGESHLVNSCAYFGSAGKLEWKCTPLKQVKFESGDYTLVILPTQ